MKQFKIGTRQSDLAMTQTRLVASSFNQKSYNPEIVKVITQGDKDLRSFQTLIGDGFFTKELEKRILNREVDLAVHSCKDLPSMVHLELPWFAYGQRESTFDILITKKENIENGTLKKKLKIGTSSPRRIAQLKKLYPQCEISEMRGNVPSRIQKVIENSYDAAVLAEAGVSRLNLFQDLEKKGLIYFRLPTVTAPCQGILAIQIQKEFSNDLEFLNNKNLSKIAFAEKSILALFGGGCHLALGAKIEFENNNYRLKFFLEESDLITEFEIIESSLSSLLRKALLNYYDIQNGKRVWFTQPIQHQRQVAKLCKSKNIYPLALPLLDVKPCWSIEDFNNIHSTFDNFKTLVFTSRFAVRIFFMDFIGTFPELLSDLKNKKIYCIGSGTQKEFNKYSKIQSLTPENATAESFLKILPQDFLFIGSSDSQLLKKLKKESRNYTFLNLYQSSSYEGPLKDFTSLQKNDSIVITSPKAAQIFASQVKHFNSLNIYAFGPTTSNELEKLKIPHKTNPVSGNWETMLNEL